MIAQMIYFQMMRKSIFLLKREMIKNWFKIKIGI